MEKFKSIRDQVRKYHYIYIPAIIALILATLGELVVTSNAYLEVRAVGAHVPFESLGLIYQIALAYSDSFLLALVANWLFLMLLAFLVYTVLFTMWRVGSRKNKKA